MLSHANIILTRMLEQEFMGIHIFSGATQRAVAGQEGGVAEAAARLCDRKGPPAAPPALGAADVGHGTAGGAGDLHHAHGRARGTVASQHPTMLTMAAVTLQCALRSDVMMHVLQQPHWLKAFEAWRLIFLVKVG